MVCFHDGGDGLLPASLSIAGAKRLARLSATAFTALKPDSHL
jgi:hypothetical protein